MRCAILLCLLSVTAFAEYDDGARYAFVGSRSEKTVYIIDLDDRSQAHQIEFADTPDSVAASETLKALIIGNIPEKKLTLVDLTSDELRQYEYPLNIRPGVVLVSPIGETVAVLDRKAGTLQIHALKRKEILMSISDVYASSDPTFNPDGSTIYWVDQVAGELHAADLWGEHRTLALGSGDAQLSAMSRSVDGTMGFISNMFESIVYVVDLRNFRLLRTHKVGQVPERPWGTADGQLMLVPNAGSDTVTAMSTSTTEILYTADTVAGGHPVSINPGWIDTVAAVVSSDGTVMFLDTADGVEITRTKLEGPPREGIVTSDSKTLAIPVPANGTLAFFDMRSKKRISSITGLPTDIGPAALAISNNLCH